MVKILKESDIKPLLKWARGNTKELVIAGIEGKGKEFARLLFKYNFFATLDSNMASIIIAFYACCIASDDRDIKKFGVTALQKGSNSYKLFEYLKAGNGKRVKDCMGVYFKKAMDRFLEYYSSFILKSKKGTKEIQRSLLIHGIKPDENEEDNFSEDKDDKNREKIIDAFIKQAGKITPWKINEQGVISDVIDKFLGTASVETKEFMEKERKYLRTRIVAKDSDYFTKNDSYSEEEMEGKPFVSKPLSSYKIFPKGKPLPSEVKQAAGGDCVLMSSLISLAKTNPKAITDCFVQGLDKIEKEDKIDIRFFRVDTVVGKGRALPVIITVNKRRIMGSVELYMYKAKGLALWPSLIEKAYHVYAKEGFASIGGKSLTFEHGDSGMWAKFAITGNVTKILNPDVAINKSKAENVIDTIKRKLKKSRALTCGFKGDFKIRDVKNNEEIKILDKHSYAIVGINEDKKYIRLIEPNKYEGRKYSTKVVNTEWRESADEGGHIAMSFDDFKNNFNTLQYSTEKNVNDLIKKYNLGD